MYDLAFSNLFGEAGMSLPDHLLDPPDNDVCEVHGRVLPCWECRVEWADEYADHAVQDRLDRNHER